MELIQIAGASGQGGFQAFFADLLCDLIDALVHESRRIAVAGFSLGAFGNQGTEIG